MKNDFAQIYAEGITKAAEQFQEYEQSAVSPSTLEETVTEEKTEIEEETVTEALKPAA